MNYLSELDKITKGECAFLFQDFPSAQSKVKEILESQQTLFTAKIQELTGKHIDNVEAHEVHSALLEKLLRVEEGIHQILPDADFSTTDSTELFGNKLMTSLSHILSEGKFLSDTAILRILHAHPPVAFLRHHNASTVDDITHTIHPRVILSSTRHTESVAWQDAYLSVLNTCTETDFELLPISICAIDADDYAPMMQNVGKVIKPWRMSHAKETGMITFFTANRGGVSPVSLLVRLLVFLHYVYEVKTTGEFIKKMHGKKSVGETLVNVILNHRDSFSTFVTPNIYDENLYWKYGLETFEKEYPIKAFSFFKDTMSLGGLLPRSKTYISLNVVDALWDIGLHEIDTDAYFREHTSKEKRFLYHMQESLWYDALQHILGVSPLEMEALVKDSLDIGDVTFTKNLIKLRARELR